MFPEDLFQFVLEQFADDIGGQEAPQPPPLHTYSYIARSAMQKAIRRGMTDLALRAAATLLGTDQRVLWRRLIVTAMEDQGVGEVDLLSRIVAASRDRAWRRKVGSSGDRSNNPPHGLASGIRWQCAGRSARNRWCESTAVKA